MGLLAGGAGVRGVRAGMSDGFALGLLGLPLGLALGLAFIVRDMALRLRKVERQLASQSAGLTLHAAHIRQMMSDLERVQLARVAKLPTPPGVV